MSRPLAMPTNKCGHGLRFYYFYLLIFPQITLKKMNIAHNLPFFIASFACVRTISFYSSFKKTRSLSTCINTKHKEWQTLISLHLIAAYLQTQSILPFMNIRFKRVMQMYEMESVLGYPNYISIFE
jgi:hypothetical protein